MHFSSDKLRKLVVEAGGVSTVVQAYEGLHNDKLARSSLQCWIWGQREPSINSVLALIEVFGVDIDMVIEDGPPEKIDTWYALVSRSRAKGPRPAKGPYTSVEEARQAVVDFQLRYKSASQKLLRRSRLTLVGPFQTKTEARRANANSTPLVEEYFK